MPDDATATQEPVALTERVRFALESGDLDAIRDLLDPGARWGCAGGSQRRRLPQATYRSGEIRLDKYFLCRALVPC